MAENDDPQPKARKNLQTSPVFATCVGPSLLSSTHPPTPQASVPQASATPSPAAPIPSPTGPPTAALPTPQASAPPASATPSPAAPIPAPTGPPTAALPTPQASAPPAPPTQPASATPTSDAGASPAAATGCWNSPSIGAALPTPSTNHPQTPSHRALALLNKNYPSTPMTPPPPPMMSYGGYRTPHLAQFASPTPSLESLELQLTQSPMTPASRPAPPTPKRRRVEPTVSRPWEGNKENEENTDNSENVNTAENWRSAKKTMRDIITAINKERSTITKGRRKNKASANRVRELDAAKDDMQRLCKVYCQSITSEWHQEANTLIRDWSYLLKL